MPTIRRGRRAPPPNARALLDALDGRRVAPGPAGSPARGRRDVLPTGRNLFTADPRMLPTPTAMDFGRLAADEVIRSYLQAHGEMPRALVIDLWGSATLRTGGEEIAQGLALMGCRPTWDHATGRVTGIEVLPTRDDRTRRASTSPGAFPDCSAICSRRRSPCSMPRCARSPRATRPTTKIRWRRRGAVGDGSTAALARIFGTAPGAYGAGIEDLLGRETGPRRASAPPILPPRRMPMAARTATARPCPAHSPQRVAQRRSAGASRR